MLTVFPCKERVDSLMRCVLLKIRDQNYCFLSFPRLGTPKQGLELEPPQSATCVMPLLMILRPTPGTWGGLVTASSPWL